MNRRKLTFELRANTPEMKALHKYLDTLKSNDSRRYNEFIKNALLTYHAHLTNCEKFLTDDFYLEEIEPAPYNELPEQQHREDISQTTKKVTSNNNEKQKVDGSSRVNDETSSSHIENDNLIVTMDDALAKILFRDDDIP